MVFVALISTVACAGVRAQELNDETERALKAAMMQVAPSVVQIETSGGTEMVGAGGPGAVIKGVGPTTGVVVSPDGYVITSAFNFANKPTAVFVTIPGQKERKVAKTVATDQTRMITLIKVEASGLTVPKAVPKKEVKIGQWAVALGRTLDPNVSNPPSTSAGIISAIDRIWGKAIQTDAKVSPVNYGGPLVDAAGRVFGILVPANPFADGDTAGVEWYDSGIGFAIPFEDVMNVIPRLKPGKDLHKGLLGVSPTGRDIYSGYSKVNSVAPDSTAAKAGIKPGDEIIEVDGKPVLNHAQLLHAMGPKYEGDTVTVKVKRGKEEKVFTNLVLTGSLTAQLPSLGILPMRDDPESGLEVRYVFPKGPADEAGIKEGDRIMRIGPPSSPGGPTVPLIPFAGRDQLMQFIESQAPGAQVRLEVKRKDGKKTETLTVRLSSADSTVPETLPEKSSAGKALIKPKESPRIPAMPVPGETPPKPGDPPRQPGDPPRRPEIPRPQPRPGDDKPPLPKPPGADKPDTTNPPRPSDPKKKVETGLLKRTNQARDHEYWILVPENYDPNVAHGLIIWLHSAGSGGKDAGDLREIWEEYCSKYHLILLGPKAENDSGWVASESEFIAGTARELLHEYTIDTQRVVVHGMGIGGQMAFYMGFNARDLIRGVATTSAVLATQPKDTVPGQRLQFFVVAGTKDPNFKDIAKSKTALGEKKYPVLYREIEMGKQYLDAKTLAELVRWIDSLDRL
jgi:S1-C subfamily serine protease